jgi:hypothetical protein
MVREKMLFLVLIAFVLAPVSASFAQHSDPMRRIGVFMYLKITLRPSVRVCRKQDG